LRRLRWKLVLLVSATMLVVAAVANILAGRGHHERRDGAQAAAVPEGGAEGARGESENARKRENWFYAQRAFPNRFTPAGALKREVAQARALRAASRAGAAASDPAAAAAAPTLAWAAIGPQPINAVPSSAGNDATVNAGAAPLAGR